MGVLTGGTNGQSFSAFVTCFGLILLISSSIYWKHLKSAESSSNCDEHKSNGTIHQSGIILGSGSPSDGGLTTGKKMGDPNFCENLETWKNCAIVGIVMGCIDLFIGPLICCCILSAVCGCATCILCCFCCTKCIPDDDDDKVATAASEPLSPGSNKDPENPEATSTPQDQKKKDKLEEFERKMESPKVKICASLFEIVLAVAPLVGTGYICVNLYSSDAMRSPNDKLYKWSLALFVTALLNLMVFAQKFLSKLCRNVVADKDVTAAHQNGKV